MGSPWPWQLLRSRRPQAPTLTQWPILGTATTGTGHTGEATMVTDTATMATTERGLLMRPPLLSLDPTPMLRLILAMATTERGLLMKEPLPPLGPTPMLRLTPGTDTTAT